MFGSRIDRQNGIYYSPEKGAGSGGGTGSGTGTENGSDDTQDGKKDGSGDGEKKEGEGEDDDLSDEDFEKLDPKVKTRIEKERKKAADEAASKTKADLEAADKKKQDDAKAKDLADRKKAADAKGDLQAKVTALEEENTALKAENELLKGEQTKNKDTELRQAACTKAKLSLDYAKNLGTDPAEYEAEAKRLAKTLNNGKGPDLEGGNRNHAGTKEQQDKVAATVANKYKF